MSEKRTGEGKLVKILPDAMDCVKPLGLPMILHVNTRLYAPNYSPEQAREDAINQLSPDGATGYILGLKGTMKMIDGVYDISPVQFYQPS